MDFHESQLLSYTHVGTCILAIRGLIKTDRPTVALDGPAGALQIQPWIYKARHSRIIGHIGFLLPKILIREFFTMRLAM